MSRKLVVLLVALAVFLLAGCSAISHLAARSAPTPAPAPTVTVTETPAAEVVEVTPQACLDALDYADEGFALAGRVIGYMQPAIQAVLDMNIGKVRQITGKLTKATKRINKIGPRYAAANAECRDKAR
jgi:PBP1b-binding outer membrane lipoprotein LpoB